MTLSKQILAKIKSEKIFPQKKWVFMAKNYGIWFLVVLGIILLGVFVGNFIYEIAMGEWDIMHRFPGGRLYFISQLLPLLWLLGIVSAFIFAFFIFRRTKHGYRYSILAASGIIFIFSSIAGVVLLSTPLPPKFREFRMQHFQQGFDSHKWMNPAKGFLFGEILVIKPQLFILNAVDDSLWEVDISEAHIPLCLHLVPKIRVRVIGKDLGENKFLADFVKDGKVNRRPKNRR